MNDFSSDVEDVREVRRRISARFNHDIEKYLAYLQQRREGAQTEREQEATEPARKE